MFFCEYRKHFKNSVFTENFRWILFSFWSSNYSTLSIYRPPPLNQKLKVGWFLLKNFVDLFRVRYIISRNIPTGFCWLTYRKQKLVQNKTLQQGLFVLISDFWQFRHINFSWDKSNLNKKAYASSRKLTWKRGSF